MSNKRDAFKEFKFQIGDVVRHRSNERMTAIVVERFLRESPEGVANLYSIRGWSTETFVYEWELDGPSTSTLGISD